MLLVHPAINPEVQGSKFAVDIFLFSQTFLARMWEHQRCNRMEHASNLRRADTRSSYL